MCYNTTFLVQRALVVDGLINDTLDDATRTAYPQFFRRFISNERTRIYIVNLAIRAYNSITPSPVCEKGSIGGGLSNDRLP